MNIFFDQSARGTSHRPDFAVVGGGLCGRLVAWQLAGAGHRRRALRTRRRGWHAIGGVGRGRDARAARGSGQRRAADHGTRRGVAGTLAAAASRNCPSRCFSSATGRWSSGMPAIAPKRRSSSGACAPTRPPRSSTTASSSSPARRSRRRSRRSARAFAQGWLLPNEGQLDNRQVLSALAAGLSDARRRNALAYRRSTPMPRRAYRDRLPGARRQAGVARVARHSRRSGARARAGDRADAAGAPAASALSALHRAEGERSVRDRRDGSGGRGHVARHGALGARTAERGVRRASRFRRGAHSRTQRRIAARRCPITVRRSSGTGREPCVSTVLPARLHDRAGSRRQRRAARRSAARAAPSPAPDSFDDFRRRTRWAGDASLRTRRRPCSR